MYGSDGPGGGSGGPGGHWASSAVGKISNPPVSEAGSYSSALPIRILVCWDFEPLKVGSKPSQIETISRPIKALI